MKGLDILRMALSGGGATAFILAGLRVSGVWQAPVPWWGLALGGTVLLLLSAATALAFDQEEDESEDAVSPSGEPEAMASPSQMLAEAMESGTESPEVTGALETAHDALASMGTSDLAVLLTEMNPSLHDPEYVFVTAPKTKDGPGTETASAPDGASGDVGSGGEETGRDEDDASGVDFDPLCTFEEEEGPSWILPRDQADAAGLEYAAVFRGITLQVHSSLKAIGFLAILTYALSERGIPVNVVSAHYHDHLFVPTEHAHEAVRILRGLQQEGDH
jgi:hypothetical protein